LVSVGVGVSRRWCQHWCQTMRTVPSA
jgi:hypothetical protein